MFHFNLTIILMILAWMISDIVNRWRCCAGCMEKWNRLHCCPNGLPWLRDSLILLLYAIYGFRTGIMTGGTDTWFINYQVNWIPSFGISFHVALDGLSTGNATAHIFPRYIVCALFVERDQRRDRILLFQSYYGHWPASVVCL